MNNTIMEVTKNETTVMLDRTSGKIVFEIWLSIEGYEGLYEVSHLGRVRSVDRKVEYSDGRVVTKKGKILSISAGANGYENVRLYKDKKAKNHSVHRLVAGAFVPNPDGKPQVNHKDRNPLNNDFENLEWVTHEENAKHAVETGYHNGN